MSKEFPPQMSPFEQDLYSPIEPANYMSQEEWDLKVLTFQCPEAQHLINEYRELSTTQRFIEAQLGSIVNRKLEILNIVVGIQDGKRITTD